MCREKGTERPFTGEYNMHFEEGTYNCVDAKVLFTSDSKFDGHCDGRLLMQTLKVVLYLKS